MCFDDNIIVKFHYKEITCKKKVKKKKGEKGDYLIPFSSQYFLILSVNESGNGTKPKLFAIF
jgi:hypothetical protein